MIRNFYNACFVVFLVFIITKCCKSQEKTPLRPTADTLVNVDQNEILQPKLPVARKFEIDYENDTFLKDGRPFRFVSGSFHYFRAPRSYWQDRLRKIRAAGLNVVATYVEWSYHEPSPGQFHFTGDRDLEYFLELAYKEDLLVLLRPGPYICAERDFGGLPPWLLKVKPNISLRVKDRVYEFYVKKWFDQLFPRITRFLYGNGGPIIMVQVENERGSYSPCDIEHNIWLRDITKHYTKDAAVLYTTDGAGARFLNCTIPDVYATVDFGPLSNVSKAFASQRTVSPRGPLVNSEYYPGWLTHWGEQFNTVEADSVVKTLKTMLELNASVNFYMFYGGTNFGFTAGANTDFEGNFMPDITSYDYDAPLTEAGDPTQKYLAIRDVVIQYLPAPNLPLPTPSPKADYGQLVLQPVASVFDSISQVHPPVESAKPLSFETLSQNYGFILYEHYISPSDGELNDTSLLSITKLRDIGQVFVDEQYATTLNRNATNSTISIRPGQKLSIFVENMGRINYGPFLHDPKGILSDVHLDSKVLSPWRITQFPLDTTSWIARVNSTTTKKKLPMFYTATFSLQSGQVPLDGYIDMSNWAKGVVFINDYNLGRYWSVKGPQLTLYLPAPYIKPYPGVNRVTVLELQSEPQDLTLQFTTSAKFRTK